MAIMCRRIRDFLISFISVICLYQIIRRHSDLLPLINEVEKKAVPSLKNIAIGKNATQSSTLGFFSASRAIDGDIKTFSHTNDDSSWLEIDMGDVYPISYVAIANRWCLGPNDLTGCLCRLSGVKLTLIDDSDNVVATDSIGNACGVKTVFVEFDSTCSTEARSYRTKTSCLPLATKLNLQSTTGNRINVFEVMVFSSGFRSGRQSNNPIEIPAPSKTNREIEGSNNSSNIALNEELAQEKVVVKLHESTRKSLNSKKLSNKASKTRNASGNFPYGKPPSRPLDVVRFAPSESVDKGQNLSTKVQAKQKTDVKKSSPIFHSRSPSHDAKTNLVHDDDKYLLFYNHDGFSNQIIGLHGAITLAAKTRRILVLPPITPHYTTDKQTLSYPLTYRPGGDRACNISFETIKADIRMLADGIELPSWSELFDFTSDGRGILSRGFPVIELAEFVRKNVTQGNFDEIEMLCNNLPYPIVDVSMYYHESSSQVAFAGSMFDLGSRVYIPLWKPSRPMFDILQQIFHKVYAVGEGEGKAGLLPEDYVGLHVRVDDKAMGKQEFNCESQQFIDVYGSIRNALKKYINQGRVVFLGTSTNTIKDCIVSTATSYDKEYLKETGNNNTAYKYRTQVVIMQDILDNDIVVSKLIAKIKVETSTVFLALDQFLIGLARDIMKINMLPHLSTYQYILEQIHEDTYRSHLLFQLSTARKSEIVGYFGIV